jgi:hypothetical protein
VGDTLTDMATRIIRGALREYWTEAAQGQGVQPIFTDIALSVNQLSRVQGFLSFVATAGLPSFTATPIVVDRGHAQVLSPNGRGWLCIQVTNGGAPGCAADWELDVALVQSMDQGTRAGAGRILVANGSTIGLVGVQTLTQTYAFGATSPDQTMVITDADGGSIIVDASGAGATVASVSALEVRQNDLDIPLPLLLSRFGGFANPAMIYFQKARGAFGAPADVQANDLLGCIDFYGRLGGSMKLGAQIIATVTNIGAGLDAQLEFWTSLGGTSTKCITTGMVAANIAVTVFFESGHLVIPNADNNGHLGAVTSVRSWAELAAYDVNAMANVKLGGGAVGGGANLTVMLPIGGTVPPAPVDQVYLGADDFGMGMGSDLAVLSVGCEEPVIAATGYEVPAYLVPIRVNGQALYLLAIVPSRPI